MEIEWVGPGGKAAPRPAEAYSIWGWAGWGGWADVPSEDTPPSSPGDGHYGLPPCLPQRTAGYRACRRRKRRRVSRRFQEGAPTCNHEACEEPEALFSSC